MESLKDIATRQQAGGPTYFDDPDKDRMVATVLSLAEEICVLRDRLDTCRRLAADGVPATDKNIDAFEVSEQLRDERLASHTAFFEQTLAALGSGD